jgi:hypothetical protein
MRVVNRADPSGLILLDSPGGGSPSEPSPIPAAPEPYEPPPVSEGQPWYEDAWDAGTDYAGDAAEGTVAGFQSVDSVRNPASGLMDVSNEVQNGMFGGIPVSSFNGGDKLADWMEVNEGSNARKAGRFWGIIATLVIGDRGAPAEAIPEGIVYRRTDLFGSKPYIGQAKRQSEHPRDHPNANFEFEIVGRANPGPSLIGWRNFSSASVADQRTVAIPTVALRIAAIR